MTIRLANSGTAVGTVVIVAVAQTVFLLPWAVLSLPVATTAFPRLAAAWDRGDTDEFRRRSGQGLRVVLAAAAGGTVLLVAVAEPAGIVLLSGHAGSLRAFAPTLVAWSIGLIGWSLVALLARTLYAAGRVRTAAAAQVAGQLTVIVGRPRAECPGPTAVSGVRARRGELGRGDRRRGGPAGPGPARRGVASRRGHRPGRRRRRARPRSSARSPAGRWVGWLAETARGPRSASPCWPPPSAPSCSPPPSPPSTAPWSRELRARRPGPTRAAS